MPQKRIVAEAGMFLCSDSVSGVRAVYTTNVLNIQPRSLDRTAFDFSHTENRLYTITSDAVRVYGCNELLDLVPIPEQGFNMPEGNRAEGVVADGSLVTVIASWAEMGVAHRTLYTFQIGGGFTSYDLEVSDAGLSRTYYPVLERGSDVVMDCSAGPVIVHADRGASRFVGSLGGCGVTVADSFAYIPSYNTINIYNCSRYLPVESKREIGAPTSIRIASFPNPFNSSTTINYSLPAAGWTEVDVVDIEGRRVSELARGRVSAGTHSVTWNGEGVPAGVYFVRLRVNQETHARKLVLLR